MQEPDYPSGPWTGFYNYGSTARRHPMDLFLRFSNGQISGEGVDDVGRFFISGGYGGGDCHWTKLYPGSHTVAYRGFREGKGIWGLWEIAREARGGFHIWPLGEGVDKEESVESTKREIQAEPVTIGSGNQGAESKLRV